MLVGGVASSAAQVAGVMPAAVQAKKKCKVVKKKVRGKVRKVRVCKKVKPAKPAAPSLPSKVSVTLDSVHAATGSISAASGGTLSAGSATLTVPPGAVAAATTVTMTPVTRLGGLGGKVLGAVQFEPDGLRFQKPVSLTFPVSSTSGLKGFSYTGDGSNFHLYPVKVESGKATLELIHFSGYGVGEQLPPPAVVKLRQRLNSVVKPAVEQAKRDSKYFEFATFRAWEFVLELAALPTGEFVKFWDELQALEADLAVALRRLIDDQHQKCVDTHDIVQTAKHIRYALWLVLPLPRHQAIVDAAAYAREQVTKCESFELDMDSEIQSWNGGTRHVSKVQVRGVPLDHGNNWTNQGALDYSYSATLPLLPSECTPTFNLVYLQPLKATLVSGPPQWYEGGSPPAISMKVYVGSVAEDYTWHCPNNDVTGRTYFWDLGMYSRHGNSPEFTISDWNYLGGSVLAQRVYSGTSVAYGDSVYEMTTFKLRHTPQ